MHPSVRKVIAAARQYTHLELGAFPRFSSKYTSRLYPKLALYAGRDIRHPLVYTPEQLAEELGWKPSGAFRFSNFEARCLRPVVDDIAAHVRRFAIDVEYRHASSRGRPVNAVVITVGEMQRVVEEAALAPMTKSDRTTVGRRAADKAVDVASEMPGDTALRQAATTTGMTVTVLAARWIDAVSTDTELQHRVAELGATEAFLQWSQDVEEDLDFDRVAKIRMRLTDETNPAFVYEDVIPFLQGFGGWHGVARKTLRLEWLEGSTVKKRDFQICCTQSDVETLFQRYNQIFEEAEFLK